MPGHPHPPCPIGSPHGEGTGPWGTGPWGGNTTSKWGKRDFPFFNPSRSFRWGSRARTVSI